MTKAEYTEIMDRTLAMSPDEIDATLDHVPDEALFRQIYKRFAKLSDYKDAVERGIHNVDKAYEIDFDER